MSIETPITKVEQGIGLEGHKSNFDELRIIQVVCHSFNGVKLFRSEFFQLRHKLTFVLVGGLEPPPPMNSGRSSRECRYQPRTIQGFHFFWACCINMAGAAILRLALSAPRPFMYDQRLRPLTDRFETSHGLPSLETHMATVVAGWWAESGGSNGSSTDSGVDDGVQPLVRLLALGYIAFVGFTRCVHPGGIC